MHLLVEFNAVSQFKMQYQELNVRLNSRALLQRTW